MPEKKWAELSRRQQVRIAVGAVVQVGLMSAALLDLRRRSPEEVNGSKRAWIAACFVNYVGPIAYFVFGRKRP